MIISVGKSRHDTKWRARELSWSELCGLLGRVQRTTETMREYKAMSREEQGRVKDIGGFVGGRLNGGRRCKAAVLDRCLVTLDADNAADDTWDDVRMLWEGALCCYSTHSSGVYGTPRLRFVIPLKRAVTPDEYPAVARKLASRIGLEFMDASTYDVSRLMYWPSCPCDAVPVFGVVDGEFIDPDEVLAEYGPGDAWKDSTLWPIAVGEEEIVRSAGERQGLPEEKPGIVGQFCRAYDIPAAIDKFLPDVYEPCGENRYTYMAGSTSGGAVMYDEGRFLYSHHGTDPCGGQLVNAFDLVRIHKFGGLDDESNATYRGQERDITSMPSYKRMVEFANDDHDVKVLRAKEQRQQTMTALEGMFDADDEEEDLEWTADLETDKRGVVTPTVRNFRLIMENDPHLRNLFGFNTLLARAVFRRQPPWKCGAVDPINGLACREVDYAHLREYMEFRWHIKNDKALSDATLIIQDSNEFNPVADYLQGLTWDGEERLDTLLVRYMGAEDTPLNRAITRKWMCGAVKRAFEPGCQFDQMLILSGPQGMGKTRLGKILSRGWFTNSITNMTQDANSLSRLLGSWFVEIAELAGMKYTDVENIKNFITQTSNSYRRAYHTEEEVYPRRCVFYGTTNDLSFLRDDTGDRRFWPVEIRGVGLGELNGLAEEVDQLWAEAVVRYRAGEQLYLTGDMRTEMEDRQSIHHKTSEKDLLVEKLQYILDKKRPTDWESWDKFRRRDFYELEEEEGTVACREIRTKDLFWYAYGKALVGNSNEMKNLSEAMDRLAGEWRKEKRRAPNTRNYVWWYVRTA